jgi:hypothetical protein
MLGHESDVRQPRMKRGLRELPARYAIVRLPADEGWPWWATWSDLAALVRAPDECTVICTERLVPADVPAERGYVAFVVDGPIPFDEVGVLAGLAAPLALAGISVFVTSTWTTDYLMVRATVAASAVEAWRNAGHVVATA